MPAPRCASKEDGCAAIAFSVERQRLVVCPVGHEAPCLLHVIRGVSVCGDGGRSLDENGGDGSAQGLCAWTGLPRPRHRCNVRLEASSAHRCSAGLEARPVATSMLLASLPERRSALPTCPRETSSALPRLSQRLPRSCDRQRQDRRYPTAVSARICGHSTDRPTPFRKMPADDDDEVAERNEIRDRLNQTLACSRSER